MLSDATSALSLLLISCFLALSGAVFLFLTTARRNKHKHDNTKPAPTLTPPPTLPPPSRPLEYPGPLGLRFFHAPWHGDQNGRLRGGLHPLENGDAWVEVCPRYREYMALKKLLHMRKKNSIWYSDPASLRAQEETLNLLLGTLARKYPQHFTIKPAIVGVKGSEPGGSFEDLPSAQEVMANDFSFPEEHYAVSCHPTGDTFHTHDFTHAPLELVGLLIQEDICLMGERLPESEAEKGEEGPGGKVHTLVAATVCFSFQLRPKVGMTMGGLHQPVQGYRSNIQHMVNRVFCSMRSSSKPLWRSNWTLRPSPALVGPPLLHSVMSPPAPPNIPCGCEVLVDIHSTGRWEKAAVVGVSPDGLGLKVELDSSTGTQDSAELPELVSTWIVREDQIGLSMSHHHQVREGDRVSGDFMRQGVYYPGVVTKVHNCERSREPLFDVLYDDGDAEQSISRDSFILLAASRYPPQKTNSHSCCSGNDESSHVTRLGPEVLEGSEVTRFFAPGEAVSVTGYCNPDADVQCWDGVVHSLNFRSANVTYEAITQTFPTQSLVRTVESYNVLPANPSAEKLIPIALIQSNQSMPQHVRIHPSNVHSPRAVEAKGGARNLSRLSARATGGDFHPRTLHVKTEFQTLQRLPISNHILFSVRTHVSALPSIAEIPYAAQNFATQLASLNPEFAEHKGLGLASRRREMSEYVATLGGV